MKKRKRRKNLFSLFGILICLIIAGVILYKVLPLYQKLTDGPVDFTHISSLYNSTDTYVTTSVDFIYDYYGEEFQEEELVARHYLIDRVDAYMGLRVSGTDMAQADALLTACQNYMRGEGEATEMEAAIYTVRGTLKSMPKEILSMYRSYLEYNNMTPAEKPLYLPYYIDVNYIESYTSDNIYFLLGSAIAVLAVATALLFSIFLRSRRTQKKK